VVNTNSDVLLIDKKETCYALYRSIKWVDIIIQVVSVSYLIGYLYVYLS